MTGRDPTPLNADWRGHTLYQCRLCPFDTLEEAKFIEHFARTHPPLEIIDGGLFDPAPEPDPEPAPAPVVEAPKPPTRRRGK